MPLPRYLFVLISVPLASLACVISLGGPSIPPDSAPASSDALETFNQKWLDLPERLTDGQFTLSFNDDEVASAVDSAFANSRLESETNIPLHNVHIALDGDIVLYVQTNGPVVNASGVMAFQPSVDAEGRLVTRVQSSEFGRASLNDPLLDQLSATVADALTRPAEALPVEVVLTSVAVVDEQLVLTGTIVE
jgi:hypothetical protein